MESLFKPHMITIQNIIQHQYDYIEKTFLQLNKNIEEQVRKTYTDIVTQTYIKTTSGVYSYQEAILQSLDELGDKGISVLTYQDKKWFKKNYDVVGTVRRDLLVATRGLAGKVNEEVIKESGHHIIRVSHHFGARTEMAKKISLIMLGGKKNNSFVGIMTEKLQRKKEITRLHGTL